MIELKLSIQDTSEYHIDNIKRLHLSHMGPILISVLNSIHVFQLCTSHMSSNCLPLFLVMESMYNVQCKDREFPQNFDVITRRFHDTFPNWFEFTTVPLDISVPV